MKLYNLLAGSAKSRMKLVMTDELHKIENYIKSRWHINIQVGQVKGGSGGWIQVVEAPADAVPWKKHNSGTGYWAAYKRADRSILPRSK